MKTATTIRTRTYWETSSRGDCRRLVRETLDSEGRVQGFEVLKTRTIPAAP